MHLVTQTEIKSKTDHRELETPVEEAHTVVAPQPSLDVVSQMRANLSQLEDLHGRLSYVMGEVRHIIKKSASRS